MLSRSVLVILGGVWFNQVLQWKCGVRCSPVLSWQCEVTLRVVM